MRLWDWGEQLLQASDLRHARSTLPWNSLSELKSVGSQIGWFRLSKVDSVCGLVSCLTWIRWAGAGTMDSWQFSRHWNTDDNSGERLSNWWYQGSQLKMTSEMRWSCFPDMIQWYSDSKGPVRASQSDLCLLSGRHKRNWSWRYKAFKTSKLTFILRTRRERNKPKLSLSLTAESELSHCWICLGS